MAIVSCYECENQVSDKAKTCPHCGIDIQEMLALKAQKANESVSDAGDVSNGETKAQLEQKIDQREKEQVTVDQKELIFGKPISDLNTKQAEKKESSKAGQYLLLAFGCLVLVVNFPGLSLLLAFMGCLFSLIYLYSRGGFDKGLSADQKRKYRSTFVFTWISGFLTIFLFFMNLGSFNEARLEREKAKAEQKLAQENEANHKKLLAQAYDQFNKKNANKAFETYKQALSLKPLADPHLTIYNRLLADRIVVEGNAAYSKKDYTLALAKYNEALKLNPSLGVAKSKVKNVEGILLEKSKAEAWAEYQKSIPYLYKSDEESLKKAKDILLTSMDKHEYPQAKKAYEQVKGKLDKIAERAAADIEVKAFHWGKEYSYAISEGQITNLTDETLENVEAVVTFYDSNGNFITSDSSLIEYKVLLPGQTSPFKVHTPANPAMSKAGIEFKILMGRNLDSYRSDK